MLPHSEDNMTTASQDQLNTGLIYDEYGQPQEGTFNNTTHMRNEEESEEEIDPLLRVDKLEQEFVKINRNQDHMYKEISGINRTMNRNQDNMNKEISGINKTLANLMEKLSTNDLNDERNHRERDNERERVEEIPRRRPEAAKDARKSLSLPIFDGSCSFKGFRMQLETYFELTEQPRHLETALFLESMRKGNKQAKEFYQEMVDSDQICERYSILMQKAEEFFAKTTTTFEYVQKLNRMRQLNMESLEDWYSRVLKIQQEAVNAKKGDSINTIKSFAIDTFINGLSDDDLRWEVRKEVKDPSDRTLRDLLKVASRTSEALQHHKSLSRSKEEEIRANFAYDRKGYQNKNPRKNTNKQAGNPITSYNYSSTPSPNSSGSQNSGPVNYTYACPPPPPPTPYPNMAAAPWSSAAHASMVQAAAPWSPATHVYPPYVVQQASPGVPAFNPMYPPPPIRTCAPAPATTSFHSSTQQSGNA